MATANALRGGDDWPAPPGNLLQGTGAFVPDGLVGLTLDQARAAIQQAGFEFADGGQEDSPLPAGQVTRTDPAPGSQSARGALVTVFTSNGSQAAFPDVVGDKATFTFNDARKAIADAGFTGSVSQACTVLQPTSGDGPVLPTDPRVGKVQASNPAPGAAVTKQTNVTLNVGQVSC